MYVADPNLNAGQAISRLLKIIWQLCMLETGIRESSDLCMARLDHLLSPQLYLDIQDAFLVIVSALICLALCRFHFSENKNETVQNVEKKEKKSV